MRSRSGQTLIEYVLAFSALVAVVALLCALLPRTRDYAERTENLVTSEYP